MWIRDNSPVNLELSQLIRYDIDVTMRGGRCRTLPHPKATHFQCFQWIRIAVNYRDVLS